MTNMQVMFRDELGTQVVDVSGDGVDFLNGYAYFSDTAERDYIVPIDDVLRITNAGTY